MTNADLAQQFLESGAGAIMAGDDATIDLVSAVVSALLAVADNVDRLAATRDTQVPTAMLTVEPKSKRKRAKPRG